MTGSCFSYRASELIFKCCGRYFLSEKDDISLEESSDKEFSALAFVNGEIPMGVNSVASLHIDRNGWGIHFSSVETYIMQPESKNKNLIDYLKGERKDLVL